MDKRQYFVSVQNFDHFDVSFRLRIGSHNSYKAKNLRYKYMESFPETFNQKKLTRAKAPRLVKVSSKVYTKIFSYFLQLEE